MAFLADSSFDLDDDDFLLAAADINCTAQDPGKTSSLSTSSLPTTVSNTTSLTDLCNASKLGPTISGSYKNLPATRQDTAKTCDKSAIELGTKSHKLQNCSTDFTPHSGDLFKISQTNSEDSDLDLSLSRDGFSSFSSETFRKSPLTDCNINGGIHNRAEFSVKLSDTRQGNTKTPVPVTKNSVVTVEQISSLSEHKPNGQNYHPHESNVQNNYTTPRRENTTNFLTQPLAKKPANHVSGCSSVVSDVAGSHQLRSRKRKFPGPAGALPKLGSGANLSQLPPLQANSPKPSVQNTQCAVSSSQLNEDSFSGPVWTEMKRELEPQAARLLTEFSLVNILRKAERRQLVGGRVPVVCVVIDSLTTYTTDTSVTLKDPTGVMQGTIHRQLMKDRPGEIVPGAVLVLRQVSVFSPSSRNHYLNITPNNLVRLYHTTSENTVQSHALSSFQPEDYHQNTATTPQNGQNTGLVSPPPQFSRCPSSVSIVRLGVSQAKFATPDFKARMGFCGNPQGSGSYFLNSPQSATLAESRYQSRVAGPSRHVIRPSSPVIQPQSVTGPTSHVIGPKTYVVRQSTPVIQPTNCVIRPPTSVTRPTNNIIRPSICVTQPSPNVIRPPASVTQTPTNVIRPHNVTQANVIQPSGPLIPPTSVNAVSPACSMTKCGQFTFKKPALSGGGASLQPGVWKQDTECVDDWEEDNLDEVLGSLDCLP